MNASVRLSVQPSVRRSVRHANVKKREINIFEQISARGALVGLLEVSHHLHETVHPPIGLSVHRSVCHTSVNQIKAKGIQEEYVVYMHLLSGQTDLQTDRQTKGQSVGQMDTRMDLRMN